jgi:hypothetical protein
MLPGRHLGDLFAATIIITIFFTTATSQPSQPPHRSQLYRLTCVHASGERSHRPAQHRPSDGDDAFLFSLLFSAFCRLFSFVSHIYFLFSPLFSSLRLRTFSSPVTFGDKKQITNNLFALLFVIFVLLTKIINNRMKREMK